MPRVTETSGPPYESLPDHAVDLAEKYMREWCYPGPDDPALKAHLINLAHTALAEGESKVRYTARQRRKEEKNAEADDQKG